MTLDRDFLEYSALDSACTLEIHNKFWGELGNFQPAVDMTMNLLPVLMFMQTRGVRVSNEALAETKIDVIKAKEEKQQELNELCGFALNVDSPKQCQEYFYGVKGYPVITGKTGRPTVDDKALQRMVRGRQGYPALREAKLVQEIRGLGKLYGTYLNMTFDEDGRMRGSYNPRGTKFGRLSSSATVFGTGTNFQNLPQEFKKFLIPDEGYCFIEVDKRQAEWVVVAYCSGDANMISAIESGTDVHVHTASLMFDVPPEIIKHENKLIGHVTDSSIIRELRYSDEKISSIASGSWPRAMSLRQCGKKSNHGLNYDEGPNGFALINEIEIPEAKRIVGMYHRIYPGIRIWYDHIKRELQEERTLTNCFGRVVRFLGRMDDKLYKSAYSMKPQSTVVDSLNGGMVEIYNDSELCGKDQFNIDILAQVHDSILMQVPLVWILQEPVYNRIISKVTDYTSPLLKYGAREFKIASDFQVGMNWGGFHSEHNPLGMQEVKSFDEFVKIYKGWNSEQGTAELA